MAKLTDFLGRPHSGLVPHTVIGIVTDNVDPEELARIQVKFPTLHEEALSYWLRVASPNAGIERGFYALPEIDDEVLVLFMQGSQDVGVIIGQFWNGMDKPPPEAKDGMPTDDSAGEWSTKVFTAGSTDLSKNDRRFWRSRSGHLFVFDDTAGAESVTIWDYTHTLALAFDSSTKLISISNKDGDIEIRAGKTVVIESGTDMKLKVGANFTHESGQASKMKAGTSFDIESGTSTKLKAGSTMDLEATAGWTAKGATAKVEAQSMATFKGGAVASVEGPLVKIN